MTSIQFIPWNLLQTSFEQCLRTTTFLRSHYTNQKATHKLNGKNYTSTGMDCKAYSEHYSSHYYLFLFMNSFMRQKCLCLFQIFCKVHNKKKKKEDEETLKKISPASSEFVPRVSGLL